MAAVAVLGVSALGATPALAKTDVRVDNGVLEIISGLVEPNDLVVTQTSSQLVVTEGPGGAEVNAGRDCSQGGSRKATCLRSKFSSIRVELKGGDLTGHGGDEYDGSAITTPQTVNAGIGHDIVRTGAAADTLNGEDGRDILHGGPGSDRLRGGTNGIVSVPLGANPDRDLGDELDGGPGGDTIEGGPGDGDEVIYRTLEQNPRTANLGTGFVQLLGEPADTVFADVERVDGAFGADTLTGSARDDILHGGGTLASQGTPDTLKGLAGDDTLIAGFNKARDTVSCGSGEDFLTLDLLDLPPDDPALDECEEIERAAIDQHPAVRIERRSARVKGRFVRVRLSCPRKQRRGCRGRLAVRQKGGRTLARRRYRIRRGKRRTVKARLSRAGRRLVARPGRLRVEVTATERDPKGRPRVTVSRFRLRGS